MVTAAIRGITYPLTIVNGGLATSIDIELIRQQIFSYLETYQPERVMRPRYGMRDELFSPIVPGVTAANVQAGLESEIPAAEFQVGTIVWGEGVLDLEIRWSVQGEQQPAIGFQLKL
jgi:phage baseplate assembly protein W